MRAAALLTLIAVEACGLPDAAPMVRVVDCRPAGADAPTDVEPSVGFSGAVAEEGIVDRTRVVLAPASELGLALEAVESDAGAGAGVPSVPAAVTLEDRGRRLVVRPREPLAHGTAYVLVLSSRLQDAEGRHVLDADGRLRPTIAPFATAPLPAPAVLLTEVLADAATPEAGGEYVEVLNLGPGPLDLAGWRFEKRSAAGSWSGCTVGGWADGAVPAGGIALLVGGGWDGRYELPEGTAVFPCGATSLAGGIANDRPPELRLLEPSGEVASLLDATAVPACARALEADPSPEEAGGAACCRCSEGSPGVAPKAP